MIHLASLIALVLKFESKGDVHGGRMLSSPDQGAFVTSGKKGIGRKANDGQSVAYQVGCRVWAPTTAGLLPLGIRRCGGVPHVAFPTGIVAAGSVVLG